MIEVNQSARVLNLTGILALVLISSFALINAQNATNSLSSPKESNQTSLASIAITRHSENNNTNDDEANQPKESLFLSRDEFVDSTEIPTLLFDDTSSTLEKTSNSTLSTDLPNTNSTTSNASTAPETDTGLKSQTTETPTSPVPADVSVVTTEEPTSSTSPTKSSESPESDDEDEASEGNEESDQDDFKDKTKQFEPPKNISQYMDYIETLFHDLRHQITDLFEPHIPQLIRTSQMVQLSSSCSYDMLKLALALRQFEPWALRLIDSSGKVPEGIFEGSFTALGSYDECISTVFASSSSSSQSSPNPMSNPSANEKSPTQGKYCLVAVSPFMPPKPPADTIEHLFQEEANKRNYTKVSA